MILKTWGRRQPGSADNPSLCQGVKQKGGGAVTCLCSYPQPVKTTFHRFEFGGILCLL
jgi:hypothetical protein